MIPELELHLMQAYENGTLLRDQAQPPLDLVWVSTREVADALAAQLHEQQLTAVSVPLVAGFLVVIQ